MTGRRSDLAMHGGAPVRKTLLPYGRQWIDEEDLQAVAHVLRSDWLTTGPGVVEFEESFARATGAQEAVAISSGTAALHASMHALGIGPGDEVIVPAMTFAATANCVVYQGASPVFADVDPYTLLIDPSSARKKVSRRTRAIISVDYAGQACAYDELIGIADEHDLSLVDDACHALGGAYQGKPVGSLADLNTFSLHPVKHITSGEGGVVTTDHHELAARMRVFRNHGISSDHRQREEGGSWFYEMVDLGYNYRLTDFQCALGRSQLSRLGDFVARRQEIARRYDNALKDLPGILPLAVRPGVSHAYHLYVIRLDPDALGADRATVFRALRAEGIGVNVHYIPVHLHPFYRSRFATGPGLCPVAEDAYERILSLPIFPRMTEGDTMDVIRAITKVAQAFS
ncbi:MAG: UDP-4-amino-4,6-dideoxy-N-acetyl-beta-L-altrosamine transaminase [Methanomicrobiales archaeon]|nr:UDP-4-amino-4,6-dideoxy-N-acetyl-beta-L-altrosamine transaminase [Methanomicrobiales archaeon]